MGPLHSSGQLERFPSSHYITPPQLVDESFESSEKLNGRALISAKANERLIHYDHRNSDLNLTSHALLRRTPPISPPENLERSSSPGGVSQLFPDLVSPQLHAPQLDTQPLRHAESIRLPPIQELLGHELSLSIRNGTHRQNLREDHLGHGRSSSESNIPRARWSHWDNNHVSFKNSNSTKSSSVEPESQLNDSPNFQRRNSDQINHIGWQQEIPNRTIQNTTHPLRRHQDSDFHGVQKVSSKRGITNESEHDAKPKRRRRAPIRQADGASDGSKKRADDLNFEELEDFSPPIDILSANDTKLAADWEGGSALDLSNDPFLNLLHPAERKLASTLRLTAARYLTCKRRIFQARVERLRIGKEKFGKTDAQQACNIDVNKASRLWMAFNEVDWFNHKHFQRFL